MKTLALAVLRAIKGTVNVVYCIAVVASFWRNRIWQLLIYLAVLLVLVVRWVFGQQEAKLNATSETQSLLFPVICTIVALAGVCAVRRWRARKVLLVRVAVSLLLAGWIAVKYVGVRALFVTTAQRAGFRFEDVSILGASYLALKLIHVVMDAAGARPTPVRASTLMGMALFPPTYATGPMHRYEEFASSFDNPTRAFDRDWAEVIRRFVVGTFKSTVIAPYLGTCCNPVLAAPERYTAGAIWLAMYAYALFIYFDFSGVADVAIGFGAAFGIRVPENFDRPYLRLDIQQFWQHWHMTLTRWLQAYIFLPLSRRLMKTAMRSRPRLIACIGYTVTFAFCGLWHGEGLNYVIWGLYHGMGLLVCTSLPLRWRAPVGEDAEVLSIRRLVWWGITFQFVCFGWILFACPPHEGMAAFGRMFGLY